MCIRDRGASRPDTYIADAAPDDVPSEAWLPESPNRPPGDVASRRRSVVAAVVKAARKGRQLRVGSRPR
eukprot:274766-Alexandrium_andersonii.AAC.1